MGGTGLFSGRAETVLTPVVSFRFDVTVSERCCCHAKVRNLFYWVCYVGLFYIPRLYWVYYVGLFYIPRPSNGLYGVSFSVLVGKGIRKVVLLSYSKAASVV